VTNPAPLPGTIILARIDNPAADKLVWGLQALNGDLSPWTHVAMMVESNLVFEALLTGSTLTPWDEYASKQVKLIKVPMLWSERTAVCQEAYRRVGSPYNWDTYFYLAAYRLQLPLITGVLKKRVANSKKLICSQAVDGIFLASGIHLFDDGRLPYDVTPGDFDRHLNLKKIRYDNRPDPA
jgi:hypothetical protein